MGGISIWQLLIILVIVLLLFGAKKLRNAGSDLGAAVKGFKDAMSDGEKNIEKNEPEHLESKPDNNVIDVNVVRKDETKKEG